MKTVCRFPLIFLLALLIPALQLMAAPGRETRVVASFSQVTLAGSATVVLVQGSPQKVEVQAEAEDLTHLETTVSGDKLRIGTKQERGMSWSNYRFKGPVTVYVTAPALNTLTVSGSGRMRAEGSVTAKELLLTVSGSGRLELAGVRADELKSAISGSGDISIGNGTAPRQDISISGSGGLQAPLLRTSTCRVRISGSGSCRVQATESLEASIMGSGSVYVSGNPKVSSSIAGSGRVRQE